MHIAHIESSMNWGGQELRTVEQSLWLKEHGFQMSIIARPGSAILIEAEKNALRVLSLDMKGSAKPGSIMKLARYIKQANVDILEAHSNRDASYAAFMKWLTRVTVVRSRHVTDSIKLGKGRKFIWQKGSHRVTTTAKAVNSLIEDAGLKAAGLIDVQIAGVDEKRFYPEVDGSALREKYGIPQAAFVVANVGMIRPDKGQRYFVEAAFMILEKYSDCYFIQVGGATESTRAYEQEVLDLVKNSPCSDMILFLGYHSDIENYIAMVDMVVIASIGTEAQTRLVPQTMLMKKNLLVTETGGLPEMVQHEQTGLIVKARSSEMLAKGIERLLQDPALAEGLRENAYIHALNNMTNDRMMRKHLQSYRLALQSNKADSTFIDQKLSLKGGHYSL